MGYMLNCPECSRAWVEDEHPPVGTAVRCDGCGETWIPAQPILPTTGAPDNNPKTRAGGMHKVPLHLIPPAPKVHLALALADGGFKYQPFNYEIEDISSSVYYGACQRHLDDWWLGADRSKDAQVKHLAAAIACLWLVLDAELHGTLHDNRPPPLDLEALMDEQSEILEFLRNRDSTKFELHDIPSAPDKA